jgi:hypothetical protein
MLQIPAATPAPLERVADVEVQQLMQQLDQPDLLRLARCNRSLLRCASHSIARQRQSFHVNVRGSEVSEDPRRAESLLRFAPSRATVSESDMDPSSELCDAEPRAPALRFGVY